MKERKKGFIFYETPCIACACLAAAACVMSD